MNYETEIKLLPLWIGLYTSRDAGFDVRENVKLRELQQRPVTMTTFSLSQKLLQLTILYLSFLFLYFFDGLCLVLESTTFLLGLVSDKEDTGFYFSQYDNIREITALNIFDALCT